METENRKIKVGKGKGQLLKCRIASGIGSWGRRSWILGEIAEATLGKLFKEQKQQKKSQHR